MDKMWGGRFTADVNKIAEEFNASISFDKRLVNEDIIGSIAHAKMLGKQGIISSQESEEIVKGLLSILNDAEKVKMCEIVSGSGAEYIKTSTGFSTAGATKEDVSLFAANIASEVKIKAAGGISSIQDAENFIDLGADRLGTSRIVKIVKDKEVE